MSVVEKAIRWSGKHERLLKSIGVAVVTTVAAVLLVLTTLASMREHSLGRFRVRAAGGPYAATIRSQHPSSEPVHATVPMQDVMLLKKGDYAMELTARGRWSHAIRFHVGSGETNELRFRQRAVQKRAIPVANAQAVPTADFDGPAVLVLKGDTANRHSFDAQRDWEANLADVPAEHVILPPLPDGEHVLAKDVDEMANSKEHEGVTPSAALDFRYVKNRYAPWADWTLRVAPRLATPVRTLDTAIDLDGDKRADTILAAIGEAALLAMNADGERLWCCKYDFPEVAGPMPDRWGEQLVLPGVIDLTDVGDLDGDGINDLAAQLIRIQPATQNDLCIAVLSGKTGKLIRGIRRPAIVVPNRASWPHAGMLVVNESDTRCSSGIVFNPKTQSIYRSVSREDRTVWYGAGDVGSKFAMPLPLKTVADKGRMYAIQCVGDETSVFDLTTGRQVGQTANYDTPYVVPKIAREQETPRIVLLAKNKQTGSDLLVVQELNGTQRWGLALAGIDWNEYSDLTHEPIWPLVEDLNGDGSDEIITPVDFQPSVGMGVQVYRLADGTPLWPAGVRQFATIADAWIQRMVVTSDVDGDGWRDIATVTFSGTVRSEIQREDGTGTGTVHLYVDWLSGKTGQPLTWSRQIVPFVSDRIQVCQIDGIRSDLGGPLDDTVEVELLTGDTQQEEQLESMTIRFTPESRHPLAVAQGLTVCGKSAKLAERQLRWYRQRPGPYSLDEASVVLLDEPSSVTQRLGENKIIAAWNADVPLIAIAGEKPHRLSVVRANDLSTVWSMEASSERRRIRSIKVAQDRIDFVVSSKRKNVPTEVSRLDGRTGKSVWSKPVQLHGAPIHAQHINNTTTPDSVLLVDNGADVQQGVGPSGSRRALHLSLVDARSGRLLWRHSFLDGAAYRNQPETLPDFGTIDVNGDGVLDICSPDQDAIGSNGMLGMTMWEGRTGRKLWTRTWFHEGYTSDYEPMPWTFINVNDRQCVAFIESANDDYRSRNSKTVIVVCDASDGAVIAEHDTEYRFSLPHPLNISRGAWIASCSSDPQNARLLAWLRDEQWRPHLVSFDLTIEGIVEREHREANFPPISQCWLRDVTEDAIPEALVITNDQLSCYASDGTQTWTTALAPREKHNRFVSWDRVGMLQDSPMAAIWLEGLPNRIVTQWIDLRSGQIVHQIDQTADVAIDDSPFEHHPPVGIPGGNVSNGGDPEEVEEVLCLASTSDGIYVADGNKQHRSGPLMLPLDPRRVRRLNLSPLQGETLLEFLVRQLKWAFITFALVVLPLACVHFAFSRRRWSLRSLLLAPAIVMVVLIGWRVAMSTTNNRVEHLLPILLTSVGWIISVYGLAMTLRNFKLGWLAVLLVTASLVLGVLIYHGVILRDVASGPFRYVVTTADLAPFEQ